MNTAVRFLKNSTALSLASIIEYGVAFLLPWYIARAMGPEAWGTYNTVIPFITISVPFAIWGLNQLLPREIGREQQRLDQYVGNSAVIGFLSSLFVTLLTVGIVFLLNYESDLEQLIIFSILVNVLPRSESAILEAIIQGHERMEWIFIIRLPLTIVRTAVSIWLLNLGYDLNVLFAVQGIYFTLITFLYIILFYRLQPQFKLSLQQAALGKLARKAVPFVAIVFTGEAFRQIDRIFISKLWDVETVGFYAAGTLPIQIFLLLIVAVMSALFPIMSRVYITARSRFEEISTIGFRATLLLVFPAVVLMVMLAEWIIFLVFDSSYGEAVTVLRISAWSIIPAFSAKFLYRILLASDHEKFAIQTSVFRSVANLGLNIVLIPRFGGIGAAVTVVVTELVGLSLNLFYVNQYSVALNFWRHSWRSIVIVMVATAVYALLTLQNHLWAGVGSLLVLIVFTILLKPLTFAELQALLQAKETLTDEQAVSELEQR